MTDRPYVDRRVVDMDAATAVARTVAAEWGIDVPKLLRRGMNAIYTSGDLVLRVGRASAPAAASHALAAMLCEHGVPVGDPITGLAADRAGFAVTAWKRITPSSMPVDWHAVGRAVRTVHALSIGDMPVDYPMPSPTAFPWWDFDGLLTEVEDHLDGAARRGLSVTIDRHRRWRSMVDDAVVVCHGDVHPGNVLMTAAGPVLIDWDLLCRAPAGWDHAMLTTYTDRWGGAPDVYRRFVSGYGCDLTDDPFTTSVAELRNVAATLMCVRAGVTDEAARAEAQRRLRYWRSDPDAPSWHAQ